MNHSSSKEESDVSDSELQERMEISYQDLKKGKMKMQGDVLTGCPLCPGKKKHDYMYKDLLQHATGVGNGSKKDVKWRAKHVALAKYLEEDLAPRRIQGKPPVIFKGPDERFVYPWMGILADMDAERRFGIKDELTQSGFHPVKVTLVWTRQGYTGKTIVRFRNGLSGFRDAMSFEKAFVASQSGKSNWLEKLPGSSGKGKYGWVARDDDYNEGDPIGLKLQVCGNLFTTAELEVVEARNKSLLLAGYNSSSLEMKKHSLPEAVQTTLYLKHAKEQEKLVERIVQLEEKLDAKQALEVKLEILKVKVQAQSQGRVPEEKAVIRNEIDELLESMEVGVEIIKGKLQELSQGMGPKEEAEINKEIDELKETLKAKEDELGGVKDIFAQWEERKRKK